MKKNLFLFAAFAAAVSMSAQTWVGNKMEVKRDSAISIYQQGSTTQKTKTDYTYDAQGNLTLELSSNWSNNTWVISRKCDYTYDAQGHMTSDIYSYWSNNTWVKSSKDDYTYDAQGNQTLRIISIWRDSAWVKGGKDEYTYDAQGNPTLHFNCNWEDSTWSCSNKYECTFDAQGHMTSSIYSYFYNNTWVKDQKDDYTYDAQGNQTSQIRSIWRNSAWVTFYKEEKTYDAQGCMTSLIHSQWSGTEWSEQYSYTDDNYYISHLYVAVPEGGVSSVYADKELIVPAGAEVYGLKYVAAGNNFDYANTTPYAAGTVLPANMGFILRSSQTNLDFVAREQEPQVSPRQTPAGVDSISSCLSGVTEETPASQISGTIYTYTTGANDPALYRFSGTTLPAYEAYYALTATSAPDYLAIGRPTALDEVSVAGQKVEKFLQNGRLVILKDGKKYNYTGQLMK